MQVKASKNNDKVFARIEALEENFKKSIRDGFQIIGQNLIRYNRDDFRKPKSGIHYAGDPNRSSAKGEAPAVQTGFLERHLYARVNGLTMFYGDDAPYAEHLEGSYLARPFLITAVRANQGNNISVFEELLERNIT